MWRRASLDLRQPAMQPLAQLVGIVLALRSLLPHHHRAGRRDAGEAGKPYELPGDSHRSA
jgi:hypothetical protein